MWLRAKILTWKICWKAGRDSIIHQQPAVLYLILSCMEKLSWNVSKNQNKQFPPKLMYLQCAEHFYILFTKATYIRILFYAIPQPPSCKETVTWPKFPIYFCGSKWISNEVFLTLYHTGNSHLLSEELKTLYTSRLPTAIYVLIENSTKCTFRHECLGVAQSCLWQHSSISCRRPHFWLILY